LRVLSLPSPEEGAPLEGDCEISSEVEESLLDDSERIDGLGPGKLMPWSRPLESLGVNGEEVL